MESLKAILWLRWKKGCSGNDRELLVVENQKI